MTLYFDTKAQFLDSDAVSTVCCWHQQQPLFAVASYHLSRGACVTLFDDTVSMAWDFESFYFQWNFFQMFIDFLSNFH